MTWPKIVRTARYVTTVTHWEITDVEPMKADYSGRTFMPNRAAITNRDGGVSAEVSGGVLKKDGTPGQVLGKHRVWHGKRDLSAEPQWLRNLMEREAGA